MLSKYKLLSIFAILIHFFVTKNPIPINSNTSSKACKNSKFQILLSVELKFIRISRPGSYDFNIFSRIKIYYKKIEIK